MEGLSDLWIFLAVMGEYDLAGFGTIGISDG